MEAPMRQDPSQCDPLDGVCFVRAVGVDVDKMRPSYSFLFDFEQRFDKSQSRLWMYNNWHTSFYWAALYLVVVFGGQYYMAKRPAFHLKKPLIIWNILLACFSILGAFRTIPELYHVIKNFGFFFSVCNPSYIEFDRVSGFWTWMFVLSKLPELVDTIFIVLRKRELIFLHWYHHITVLCFSWYFYQQHIAPARYYVVMNYIVHSMMYSYFALRALDIRLPKFCGICITSLQILQMGVGFYVTFYGYITQVRKVPGVGCAIVPETALLSIFMYLSYFVLFGIFFYRAYMTGSGKRKLAASKEMLTNHNGKKID